MQLATTAKNTSDNVTGSLSYINDLVTGATAEGLYQIFVGQQFLNDSMVADLKTNYGCLPT
jgi:carbohydrate-selective porin OprB